MLSYNPAGLAIPLFLFFMLVEYLVLKSRGMNKHRYNDSINSLSMGLLLLTSDALLKTITFTVFIYLYQNHALFEFANNQLFTWILFFFLVDLCYYWFHRCAHQYNILWGAHVGHHQSEEYNLTTALRQSAFQYAFSWVFYLPLAILGCPPEVFLGQFVILKMYQFGLHTQAIDKISLVEGFFSTPSSHRVHHAKNPMYIDRNYGGTLVIWDRLFGTWQPEMASDVCHYGTTKPLDTLNPIKANLQHWSVLLKDTIKTKSIKDKILLWFKPTGWRPQDCMDADSSLQHDGIADHDKFDPKTSKLANIYVGFSMLAMVVLAVMFLFKSPILQTHELLLGVVNIVLGVYMLNRFLEGRFQYWFIECIRWPLYLFLTINLATAPVTSKIVQSLVINKPVSEVYSYVTIPTLWHEWHKQSLSVEPALMASFEKEQVFNEVIQTKLGQDHLSWIVQTSEKDKQWIATAFNEDKKVDIRLQYDFESRNGQTYFTRTLHYDVPNFLYHVVNVLYFNKQMHKKSKLAIEHLKEKVESM